MGFFPPGTLLLLSTNEAAVVLSVPADRAGSPPRGAAGLRRGAGSVVNLAADPRRKVVRAIVSSDVGRSPLPWVIGA